MGNVWNSKNKIDVIDTEGRLSRAQFYFHYPIGINRFGTIWKAEHRSTKELYALKQLKKSEIFNQRWLNSVLSEREILSRIRHAFIANIYFAFQDNDYLYLAVELVAGADLGYHMRKRKFKEVQAKFIMASIIVSLEYLHNNNILHRNVQPSNVLIDKKGYVKLSDFVLARELTEHNASDTSGSPNYMAPEIMCRQNYSFSSDYYALGVIGYQMMLRRMPYQGVTRKEIIDQIKTKQMQLKKHEIPEGWSLESADFINKCLQRKPEWRLGLNGPIELKQHVWLRDFDWQGLVEKEIPSYFIPKTNLAKRRHKRINIKTINSRQEHTITEKGKAVQIEVDKNGVVLRKIDQNTGDDLKINSVMDGGNWSKSNTEKRVEKLLRRPTIQKLFEGYSFDYEKEKHKYQHLEENSEQSWYLDSKGNIKEKRNGDVNGSEDDSYGVDKDKDNENIQGTDRDDEEAKVPTEDEKLLSD